MTKKITYGKIIAFIISVVISGFVWNVFFPPGGLAANILLGLLLAYMFIQYFVGHFGPLIDEQFFPGGSKKRAHLYRVLTSFIKQSETQLLSIKKSKRKMAKYGHKAVFEFEKAIQDAKTTVDKVAKEWDNSALMTQHEEMLDNAYKTLEIRSKAIFSLDKGFHFVYGIPSLILLLGIALLLREFVIEPYQIPSGSMIPTLLPGDHLFVLRGYYGLSKPFVDNPDFFIQWKKPKVGDVVVFKSPGYVGRHANQSWIKRVIATEGQTVKVLDYTVYVDGKPYEHVAPETIETYMDFFGFGGPDGGTWREQKARLTIEQIGDLKHKIYLPMFATDPRIGPYWPPADFTRPGLSCADNTCKVKEGYVFVVGDNRGNSADSRDWGALPISRIKGKAAFVWMSVDGSKQSLKIGPFTLPRFRWERFFNSIS